MGMKLLKHLIAILLMRAPLVIIDAQSLPHAGNHRSFGWDLGYGFYDPAPHTRLAQYPNRFTGYGGLLISVRYLGKPVRLVPSLSFGVEAGVQTLAHEESSFLYYIDSGDPVIESVDGVGEWATASRGTANGMRPSVPICVEGHWAGPKVMRLNDGFCQVCST